MKKSKIDMMIAKARNKAIKSQSWFAYIECRFF
jgi:hypothetical protein